MEFLAIAIFTFVTLRSLWQDTSAGSLGEVSSGLGQGVSLWGGREGWLSFSACAGAHLHGVEHIVAHL